MASLPVLHLSKFVNRIKICSLPSYFVVVPVGDYVDCGRSRELLLCIKPQQEKSTLYTSNSAFLSHTTIVLAFGSVLVADLGFTMCFVEGVRSSFPGH